MKFGGGGVNTFYPCLRPWVMSEVPEGLAVWKSHLPPPAAPLPRGLPCAPPRAVPRPQVPAAAPARRVRRGRRGPDRTVPGASGHPSPPACGPRNWAVVVHTPPGGPVGPCSSGLRHFGRAFSQPQTLAMPRACHGHTQFLASPQLTQPNTNPNPHRRIRFAWLFFSPSTGDFHADVRASACVRFGACNGT